MKMSKFLRSIPFCSLLEFLGEQSLRFRFSDFRCFDVGAVSAMDFFLVSESPE